MKKLLLLISVIFIEIVIIFFLLFEIINVDITSNFQKSTVQSTLPLFWEFDEMLIPSNNSRLMVELKPNSTIRFDGFVVRLPLVSIIKINSDGFRDREYTIEKPPNTYRIIVLGDSVAMGFGVNNDEPFSEVLERKLNSLNSNVNYEVLNFGVWGYGTIQEVELLKYKGLKYEPDMIILEYHGTDIYDDVGVVYQEWNKQILQKLNITNLSNLSKEDRIKLSNETYLLRKNFVENHFEEAWKITESALEELCNLTKQNNISVVIMTVVTPENVLGRVETMAKKCNWHLINSDPTFFSYPNEKVAFPKDGHPNVFGHEVLADLLFNYIVNHKLIPV